METAEAFIKKFPNLHKLIGKSAVVDEVENYIYIKDKYAIIQNEYGIVIFDLINYFENQVKIGESYLVFLDDILALFEGKYLSYSYWEQLTKGFVITFSKDGDHLVLDNAGVILELIYKDPLLIINNYDYSKLIQLGDQDTAGIHCSSIPFGFMTYLSASLGSLLKNDTIMLEHLGRDVDVRFTFNQNRFIFGLVSNNYNHNHEQFKNHEFSTFLKDVNE